MEPNPSLDNLADNLFNCCEVTLHPNNPNAAYPRSNQYKNAGKDKQHNQEQRRRKILENRKTARYDLLRHVRDTQDGSFSSSEQSVNDENGKAYAKPKEFKDFLMLSEWLVDVPENFANEYLAKPCPVGKRCLVVTGKGKYGSPITTAYSKSGQSILRFNSPLPGGSKFLKRKTGVTILDCIYKETEKLFYILDTVCWNSQPYHDCDTIFRFTWGNQIIEDYMQDYDLSVATEQFPYRFLRPAHFNCDAKTLESMVNTKHFDAEIDGILFYHKDNHYTHGPSPLVCWLKTFMFPEILRITIPVEIKSTTPVNYTNVSSHILEYEAERNRMIEERKAKRHFQKTNVVDGNKQLHGMDVEPSVVPEEGTVQ